MTDDRDWYKGTGEEQRSSLRTAVQAAEKRDDSLLFDAMFVGVAAYRIMRGTRVAPDSVCGLLAQMIADCEITIREHSMVMLAETDPASPAAREAHFKARVAASMVGMLNDYVTRGATAQDAINNPSQP